MTMLAARLQRKAAEAKALLREGDLLRLFFLATRRFPSSLLRVRLVLITRGQSIPAFQSPANVVYRSLHPDELLPLASLPTRDGESPETLQARFRSDLRQGREGFVAEIGPKVIAYAWVAYDRCPIPGMRFDLSLRPDEACTYRSYVDPAYRYSRVYAGLAKFVLTTLRSRGIRTFFGYADFSKRHSVRTHQRLGYEIVGWILLIQLPLVDVQVTRIPADGGGLTWRLLRRKSSRPGGAEAPSLAVTEER